MNLTVNRLRTFDEEFELIDKNQTKWKVYEIWEKMNEFMNDTDRNKWLKKTFSNTLIILGGR
jgi:hypothetical protein